jgi:hypothetical protein
MKRLLVGLIASAVLTSFSGFAFAQGVKDSYKDVGKSTKKAAKETGKATKDTSKKVVNKGAKQTKKGASKIEQKTNPKAKPKY